MNIQYRCQSGVLRFQFEAEPDDPLVWNERVKMGRRECEIRLPDDFQVETVHPDVIALTALLIVYPFMGKNLTLPRGVTQAFHDHFKKWTKKNIGPVNASLKPRTASEQGVPALAFSGGVDSTAAAVLLPRTTQFFFLDRIIPEGTRTLYNKEAPHYACQQMRERGRSMYMIESDLEYVRDPVGFPIDAAHAVGPLLLADYAGLDCIAFGTIFDLFRQDGTWVYEDYTERLHHKRWAGAFELVGLPFAYVVSGITEIGTMKIAMNSPHAQYAQSCLRGRVGDPCKNCFKCFRKLLLERIVEGRPMDDDFLDRMFRIEVVHSEITEVPMYLEIVMGYITSHYEGQHELMNLFKRATRGDVIDFSWLEKYQPKALKAVPEKYRDTVEANIRRYLEPMSDEEEQRMLQFGDEDEAARREREQVAQELKKRLADHVKKEQESE